MYTGGTLCDPFGMGSFRLVVYDSSNCRFFWHSLPSAVLVWLVCLLSIALFVIWTLFHYDVPISLGGLR
jgi:hypothetical protein